MLNEHDFVEKRREALDLLLVLEDMRAQPGLINWGMPGMYDLPNLQFLDNSWLQPTPYQALIDGHEVRITRIRTMVRPELLQDMVDRIKHFIDAPITLPEGDSPSPTKRVSAFQPSSRRGSMVSPTPIWPHILRTAPSPMQGAATQDAIPEERSGSTSNDSHKQQPPQPKVMVRAFAQRMHKGFFLRGCLGSGKSHLLLLFAVYLRLVYTNVRTVYIGDCEEWDKCDSAYDYIELILEAIACSLVDHEAILGEIDTWKDYYRTRQGHAHEHVNELIVKICEYCQQAQLKLVFIYDNVDKLASDKQLYERIAYRTLMNLKRRTPCFAVFSSFDDNITEEIKRRFTSTHLYINSSFSREEGVVFMQEKCKEFACTENIINEAVKNTWFHPNELRRLCRSMTARRVANERDFMRAAQQFREEESFTLRPRPYSSHTTVDNDIKMTIFCVYFSFPCENPVVDWNFIDTSGIEDGVLRFSCPRVANLVFAEQIGDEKQAFEQIGMLIGDTDEARHQLAVAAIRWILDKTGELIEERSLRMRSRDMLRYMDVRMERIRALDVDEMLDKMYAGASTLDTNSAIVFYSVSPTLEDVDFVIYDESAFASVRFVKCLMLNPLKLKIQLRHIDTTIAKRIQERLVGPGAGYVDYYVVCGRKAAAFASRRPPTANETGCNMHIVDITSLNWINGLEIFQFN
ncbi:hypothetical protein EC988_004379 [Linderina pennispora]|nr:hypothetical protein EC988_004379 [Linderina pennispora]